MSRAAFRAKDGGFPSVHVCVHTGPASSRGQWIPSLPFSAAHLGGSVGCLMLCGWLWGRAFLVRVLGRVCCCFIGQAGGATVNSRSLTCLGRNVHRMFNKLPAVRSVLPRTTARA